MSLCPRTKYFITSHQSLREAGSLFFLQAALLSTKFGPLGLHAISGMLTFPPFLPAPLCFCVCVSSKIILRVSQVTQLLPFSAQGSTAENSRTSFSRTLQRAKRLWGNLEKQGHLPSVGVGRRGKQLLDLGLKAEAV